MVSKNIRCRLEKAKRVQAKWTPLADLMPDVNSKASKPPLRLPCLETLPTQELIQQISRTLHQNSDRMVILPWNPDETKSFVLAVTAAPTGPRQDFIGQRRELSTGDPEWRLFAGFEPVGKPVWSYITHDLELILNLMLGETTFSGFDGISQPKKSSTGYLKPDQTLQMQAPNSMPAHMRQASGPHNMMPQQAMQPGMQQGTPLGMPGMQGSGPLGMQGSGALGMQPGIQGSGQHALPMQPNPGAVNLSGNMSEVELTSVMQSITLCKMTGKLEVSDNLRAVELYFDDGNLVHASFQDCLLSDGSIRDVGDNVVVELLTWEAGAFKFNSGMKTNERSVQRRVEGMLMEGAALRDYMKSLANLGFSTEAKLVKKNPGISEAQFEDAVRNGVPIDLNNQKRFYMQIGEGTSVSQILQRVPLPKVVWLPIVFNLVNCDLLTIGSGYQKNASASRTGSLVMIDATLIQGAYREMVRFETGLLPYPLFLYFLQQEYFRFRKNLTPFSVAVFDLRYKRGPHLEPISNAALKQIALHMEKNLREDLIVIGHFQALDFAMLLPSMSKSEAEKVCERFSALLGMCPLDGIENPADLQFKMGLASIPEDCKDLPNLLGNCLKRKG
jgi:GGDEF domain-containing protein